MRALFGIVGVISLLLGILAIGAIRSDIQLQLVATLILGGFVLIGVTLILTRLDRLLSASKQASAIVAGNEGRREPRLS